MIPGLPMSLPSQSMSVKCWNLQVDVLQLYTEEGGENESCWAFRSRVGIDYLRERLTKDPQGRSVLLQRFFRAQSQRGDSPAGSRRDTTPRAG